MDSSYHTGWRSLSAPGSWSGWRAPAGIARRLWSAQVCLADPPRGRCSPRSPRPASAVPHTWSPAGCPWRCWRCPAARPQTVCSPGSCYWTWRGRRCCWRRAWRDGTGTHSRPPAEPHLWRCRCAGKCLAPAGCARRDTSPSRSWPLTCRPSARRSCRSPFWTDEWWQRCFIITHWDTVTFINNINQLIYFIFNFI